MDDWYCKNNLELNKNKFHFISFGLSNINTPNQILIQSYCDNCKGKQLIDICNKNFSFIARIGSARYLGVIFNEHLK